MTTHKLNVMLFLVFWFNTFPNVASDSPPECPSGAVLHNNYCYTIQVGSVTWKAANEACIGSNNGRLVILDDDNTAFVKHLAQNVTTYWIGLRLNCPNATYSWVDGTFPSEYNWVTNGEPPNVVAEIGRTCAFANSTSGKWGFTKCDSTNTYGSDGHRSYICQSPKFGYTIPIPTIPTKSDCGLNWCRSGIYCYKVIDGDSKVQKSQELAEESCQIMGQGSNGHLVSLHSIEENNFVLNMIDLIVGDPADIYSHRQFVIGLSLLDSQDENFYWTDGTSTDFVNWAPNQPDASNLFDKESCVEMFDTATGFAEGLPDKVTWIGKWNDQRCDDARPYVCKKIAPGEKIPSTPTPPPSNGGCRPGWRYFQGRCYIVHGYHGDKIATPLKHADADKFCQNHYSKLHTSLVSIRDINEQYFVQSLLADARVPVWIGVFVSKLLIARWTDQTRMLYTNWVPDAHFVDHGCAYMKNARVIGKWQTCESAGDDSCETQRAFVCAETTNTNYTNEVTYVQKNCSVGYVSYGNNCFKIFGNELSWEDAELECAGVPQTHLASIQNAEEFAFMSSYAKSQGFDDFWIGLKDPSNTQMVWKDGYPVYYTRWGKNEPSGDKACVYMAIDSHEGYVWKTENCGSSKKAYICNKRPDAPTSNVVNKPGKCPALMIPANDGCYFVDANNVTNYHYGTYLCRKIDPKAKLASFHSLTDVHQVISSSQIRNLAKDVVIGLFQSSAGRNGYIWDDGSVVDYDNWADGEPENSASADVEECVYMDETGFWHDTNCGDRSFYALCERPKDVIVTTTTIIDSHSTISILGSTGTTVNPLSTKSTQIGTFGNGSTVQQPKPSTIIPSGGLSGGSIAGIVISVIASIAIVIGVLVWKGIIPIPNIMKKSTTRPVGLPSFMDSNGGPSYENMGS